MITVAICDDVVQICSYIEKIISDHCKKILKDVNIQQYYSGESLIEDIESNHKYYDIIFLDIRLGKLNGIKVGEKIRKEFKNFSTQIVYVSAYASYAMELFLNIPFGFLIKPFKEKDVEEIIDRWILIFGSDSNIFTYKKGTEVFRVKISNIIYFESIGRQVEVYANNFKDNFYGSIKDVFVEVEKYGFIYAHRAYLINCSHITKINYDTITMSNSDIIPISQPNRKELRHFFLTNNIDNENKTNI